MDERLLFHLTGKRTGTALAPADGLRPALFARTGDLVRLRYDFPIVMPEDPREGPAARALSEIVDELLREIAPRGFAGDRTRRHVLRLEREIRVMLAEGSGGTLGSLWDAAARRVASRSDGGALADLERARAALRVDGDLVDCDAETAARLVARAWRGVQGRRARPLRRTIDELVVRLSDLVRADMLRSAEGRRADALRAGVGQPHRALFDFELMAHLIATPSGGSALPGRRRRRIESALAVLRAQRFFGGREPYRFAFDRTGDALAAYRERMPRLAELVRAIAIGELEVEGRYVEAEHDAYFAAFGEHAVGADDLALFPGYLVRLAAAGPGAARRAEVTDALASGAPVKVLLEVDDVFAPEAQLAAAAMGLGGVYVVQCPSSHLLGAAPSILAALEHPGPALVSVFTGAGRALAPYLVAAAALESRAFPAFSYDPAASDGRRVSLIGMPQSERTWPVHALEYADDALQRRTERVAFTSADLALLDPSWADHFARVPRERWDGRLVPLAERLEGEAAAGEVPFVYAVDAEGGLHKLVADARATEAARRHGDAWLRLRELARRPEPVVPAAPPEAPTPAAVEANGGAPTEPAVAEVAAAAGEHGEDEAYIETLRCTTCNECTLLNPRMFAYDENKQAYIADLSAGTYRELVEAAEGCQVAIIHPGPPRDPAEPGLDELLERAAAFR